jgi:fluoride exporter
MTLLLVAVGAAIGAPLRYLTDRFIQARHDTIFPWGTLTVNIPGSIIFGVLMGMATTGRLDPAIGTVLGPGFCGALTTYSTFGYETLRLAEDGSRFLAGVNIAISLLAGLGAAFMGFAIAAAL